MTIQPEQALENKLIEQLQGLKYQFVTIKDEGDLLANLKTQLEKHNGVSLTQKEFAQVINQLSKGSVFDKAKTLRDKFQLTKENGESIYLEFIQQEHWCQNIFQVTNQVAMEGKYKNRYDVTLLMNGIPIAQIELKRRGIELKEAFNQVKRYQKHSFGASLGLFQYVQFYVISNGVNTKYFSNQKRESFKNTFYWSDKENNIITNLEAFTQEFLEPCHMSKMICKYVVINETMKALMILRPYQFYAVEAIIDRVKNSTKNGYIWHTTGSGKTLTSFKAAQVLMKLPKVHKVVFVVDRKDLDFQTAKEYNSFQKDSVSSTDNTEILVKQFSDDTPLIVTTIQKLNTAISKKRYTTRMEHQKDKKIVFIFDECHRSQFGDTHEKIKDWFQEAQMFGFTGTPIFAENAAKNEKGKRTTKDLFEECLHKYVITDAIRDENVLKFSIEYVGRYREKEGSRNDIDIEVEDIDTKELLESPERLRKIVDYVALNHDRKTHSKRFTAMFCVSGVKSLIHYYELFKAAKAEGKHNLKIATIFSYNPNEEDANADGQIGEEVSVAEDPRVLYGLDKHSREKLDEFIDDYNKMFGVKYSTRDSKSFYDYYNDISSRVKKGEVDILLVVNMFLTGFDSKKLNTIFVDKNLKYHGLIQAFSRTNRTLDETKSQGNIVCFRNLKKATDDAIALFSNKDAREVILMEPYENYIDKFKAALEKMKEIAPTVGSVDALPSEEEEFEFVKAFRELLRLKNVLSGFADFDEEEIGIDSQEFEDYKSKYLDIHDKVRNDRQKEKVSILDDVDFELELIHRDEINVAYILKLLAQLKGAKAEDHEKRKKEIIDAIAGDAQLRSKKELIEKFIHESLPNVEDMDQIDEVFESFWTEERSKALSQLADEEQLNPELLQASIDQYLFTERKPLGTDVLNMIEGAKPKLAQKRTTIERIVDKMVDFVDTFIGGMGE
ncbi:type I restriction endonuclease subunit R [Roseivirga echinicomitans]|uniref:Type I restriction enzyme endonuclease subunit n=1 Tax=Roseivirga echinicomitans TaxID=296218 RepID=A0A150XEN4_9BACT|nr:type I restriction endonuclease subunit R [Roseivirga echinicomitans]KYG77161.1 deoxyribonuclease HsdR [Roseivirga echinicomitans]